MNERDIREHWSKLQEQKVENILRSGGFAVARTDYHGAHGLTVNLLLRIEVKAARWTKATNRKGRYQFCLHNNADVYVLACCTSPNAYFIIPASAIGERKQIAIWSSDPSRYRGMWAEYLENWDIIYEEFEKCLRQHASDSLAKI